MGWLTLFGLYEVIEAVKTIDPLVLVLIKDLAATVAQFQAPKTLSLNSCSTCAMLKSNAGRCLVMPAFEIMPSKRPDFATTSSIAFVTLSSEVTSTCIYSNFPGLSFWRAAKSSDGAEMSRE